MRRESPLNELDQFISIMYAHIRAPIGTRPPMLRDDRHDWAYILDAICSSRGAGAAMITLLSIAELNPVETVRDCMRQNERRDSRDSLIADLDRTRRTDNCD